MRSRTRNGPEAHSKAVGPEARDFAGRLRRMIVTRSSSSIYQVTGHTLLDADTETKDAEHFGAVGFSSRPSSDEDTEAIVAFVGGPGNPIIVATRQEAVRKSMSVGLLADETQLHNSLVLIRIKSNGTVEIRTKAGTASPLATLDDLQELRDWIHDDMVIAVPSAGSSTPGTTTPPPTPAGTSVLKAQ